MWWLLLVACSSSSLPKGAVGALPAAVVESSGLVAAHTHVGWWTHNDSGDRARLFGVGLDGALVREVAVRSAGAVDWEAITADGAGHLWIGDIGNNGSDRRDLVVYRVPEPPAGVAAVDVDRRVAFRYPDQVAFPDPALRFDAEGLFFADGTLWLFTKHRTDDRTVLYRFPALAGEVVLERAGELALGGDPENYGGMATDAALAPDGTLALLTYHALFLLERPAGGAWTDGVVHTVALDQDVLDQCEGLAWRDGDLWITNEDRALFRIRRPRSVARFP